jgi:nucleoside-diphosphate-sugar epimerase
MAIRFAASFAARKRPMQLRLTESTLSSAHSMTRICCRPRLGLLMLSSAASSDHRGAVVALISGLSGSGKPLIHSSGSSIVADLAMGEPSDRIFDEMTPIVPLTERAARIAIDQLVLTAPGIQSVVLCNSMIYGSALGSPAESVQIPALVRQAKVSGVARYIGRGLNRWSNVHIADVAALYVLAIARAPAGSFMYVESGEEALGEIVRAIAALGSNSRVRGRAAVNLGWLPAHRSITRWIASDLI